MEYPVQTQKQLDEHVAAAVRLHFDPQGGSPYWIRKARELGIDALEIGSYKDLQAFGLFDPNELRYLPPSEFSPKSRMNFQRYCPRIFETGGSTGIPKRIIDSSHQEANAHWVGKIMRRHGFGDKGNWLDLFPSGPHAVSWFTQSIARSREELCYRIDIDPRWVKVLCEEERFEILDRYLDHVMKQACDVLRSQEIGYLFATPKLLARLADHYDFSKSKIRGILCGGTQITPEFHRLIRTEIAPQADFCALYGNTLMGVAPQFPSAVDSSGPSPWSIAYYPHFPHFVLELVDEADTSRVVAYGERGRVKLAVMNEDVFIPAMLERDSGIRMRPIAGAPWDGIADVTTCAAMESCVAEGVY
jgi:phenylacetate-coenzyme A ligase PaaK-like adenylate-forming protein